MRIAKRIGLVAAACIIATALTAPAALALRKAHSIKTTQRITTLSSTPQRATNVGTTDGRIGDGTVHGALRAAASFTTTTAFTAAGTLFYRTGTLTYTLHGTATANPDGSLKIAGSGRFVGGSGRYAGARGSFRVSGSKPANSFETWLLIGKVIYR